MLAAFVASKGRDDDAVKHACMSSEWLGHRRATVRSDQESSFEDLIRGTKKRAAVDMVPKESPVGDSQSNGMTERTVQDAQRQRLSMKSGLEERIWGVKSVGTTRYQHG